MIESEVLKDFQKLSSIIEEKQQKIVDLEAKLEKKEFAINNYWKSEKNKKEMFREENKKLKQQLAEKEKEIEYQESMKILAVKNQNQTAIAELEKVIKFAKTQDEFGFRKSGMEIFMFIDQQIKLLKGDK